MGQNLIDFKNFIKSDRFNQLTKGISDGISHGLSGYLGGYEKKMRSLVKDLDLKSRDARSKSREQLDRFANQIKTTRGELEKRVVTIVNHEADRLNKGFNELVTYLKALSQQEQASAKRSKKAKPAMSAKKKTSGKKVSTKSTSAPRRPRKKSSSQASSASVN